VQFFPSQTLKHFYFLEKKTLKNCFFYLLKLGKKKYIDSFQQKSHISSKPSYQLFFFFFADYRAILLGENKITLTKTISTTIKYQNTHPHRTWAIQSQIIVKSHAKLCQYKNSQTFTSKQTISNHIEHTLTSIPVYKSTKYLKHSNPETPFEKQFKFQIKSYLPTQLAQMNNTHKCKGLHPLETDPFHPL